MTRRSVEEFRDEAQRMSLQLEARETLAGMKAGLAHALFVGWATRLVGEELHVFSSAFPASACGAHRRVAGGGAFPSRAEPLWCDGCLEWLGDWTVAMREWVARHQKEIEDEHAG